MAKPKQLTFNEYRYQLLPISQHELQLRMGSGITSLSDLIREKNNLFRRAISSINVFSYPRTQIAHQVIFIKDNIIIIKIGVERDLKRTTRDFTSEAIDNWPTVLVAFNNDREVQKCLVQKSVAFNHTSTVVKLFEYNIKRQLFQYQLSVGFEPIYKEEYFWNLVKTYEDRIVQINFELISPNMSNISASLKLDLHQLNKTTNTQRTNLQLNSDESSHLTPSKEDDMVDSLVEYSSEGGGNITMKVKGLNRKVQTAKGVNEIAIDELSITTSRPEDLGEIFKSLIK